MKKILVALDRCKVESTREYTPEGFLRAYVNIARTGIYEYLLEDIGIDCTDEESNKIVKIYKSPEMLSNRETFENFKLKPLVITHGSGLVSTVDAKSRQVGSIGEDITFDGTFLRANIIVTDQKAIELINQGVIEVSPGYKTFYRMEPGVTSDGQHYDGTQEVMIGNHLAIVERGRGGSSCSVLDSFNEQKKDRKMTLKKIVFDSLSVEVTEQGEQIITKLQSDLKAATDESIKKQAEYDSKIMDLQKQLEDEKNKNVTLDQMDKAIEERSQIIEVAKKILKDFSATGKSNDQIIEEVASQAFDSSSIADKSDDYKKAYLKARFDIEAAKLETASDGAESIKIDHQKVLDSEIALDEKARSEFIKRSEELYKTKG